MRKYYSFNPWIEIVEDTFRKGSMAFSKEFEDGTQIPPPASTGIFRPSIGITRGQKMDWRVGIKGTEKCIHVLEFSDRYETHVDNLILEINLFSILFLMLQLKQPCGQQVLA